MQWTRLYLIVEGQTEQKFAKEVLGPHLAQYSIDLRAKLIVTNRKKNKRGGLLTFSQFHNDLIRLMRQDQKPEARFTTMLDLYRLPPEFPGWIEGRQKTLPIDRVLTLEKALQQDIDDQRFLPYIQLHEFEALLYCDLSQLIQRVLRDEEKKALTRLQQEVDGLNPEDVNEGEETSPSKRIIKCVPRYDKNKVRLAPPIAAAIGLPALRAKCPHFDAWISQLEKL